MASLIETIFKNIITGSVIMQGRFALLEGGASDLNADNNDEPQLTATIASQVWQKKYPCVIMYPMRRLEYNRVQNTVRYAVQLAFCATTYYEGTGSITNRNPATNTSKTEIKSIQDAMCKAADDFYVVLQDKVYDDFDVRKNVRTVKSSPYTVNPFSLQNNDRLSGAMLNFQLDIATGCNVSDYYNSEVTIADYATFNSDFFLNTFCIEGRGYGYNCSRAEINGSELGTGDRMNFYKPDTRRIPIQEGERITIPNHDTDTEEAHLSYDHNFITFLQSLPIAKFLKFRTSPFNYINAEVVDAGFPTENINGEITEAVTSQAIYGEGFQIEYPKDTTFEIEVEFHYFSGGSWSRQHVIKFKHRNYEIDGGDVAAANIKTFKEYVF